MKKAFILSIILHTIILVIIFVSFRDKIPTGTPPFQAKIITPKEFKENYYAHRSPKGPRAKVDQQLSNGIDSLPSGANDKTKQSTLPPIASAPKQPEVTKDDKGDKSAHSQQKSQKDSSPQNDFSKFKGINPEESKSPPSSLPLRDKLFDRDVIGKLAQKKNDTTRDESVTFDTKEFKYYSYMQRLKEKILSVWTYPAIAAERGIYGDLRIKFVINKNGQLGPVQIIRTSGHKVLDDAALKAIMDAEPYWPLPNEWNQDTLTITGYFIYNLGGNYIR